MRLRLRINLMDAGITILPKTIDHRHIEELMESDPKLGPVLELIRDKATQMNSVELKLFAHHKGWINGTNVDRMALNFKEFIENVIAPHQDTMGEVYDLHDEW